MYLLNFTVVVLRNVDADASSIISNTENWEISITDTGSGLLTTSERRVSW